MPAQIMLYEAIGEGRSTVADVAKALKAVPPSAPVAIHINSPGGDVVQAMAIADIIARHPGPVTAYIDGLAASSASYIAMAAGEVVMPEDALMMMHYPSGASRGTAERIRKAAESVERFTAAMVASYARRSRLPTDRIETMLAAETWLTAAEAVELGFADRVEQPMQIAAQHDLRKFGYRHGPSDVQALAASYWAKRGKRVPVIEAVEAQPPGPLGDIDHEATWAKWNRQVAE